MPDLAWRPFMLGLASFVTGAGFALEATGSVAATDIRLQATRMVISEGPKTPHSQCLAYGNTMGLLIAVEK